MKKFAIGLGLALSTTLSAIAGVNVNTLDAETLALELDGVGLSKAQAIVEYRQENGDFKSTDDLQNVKGIGPAIIEKNKQVIDFE